MLTGKEIRSYHRIEDLLAQRGVVLKQDSEDRLLGLCPFHQEKTPSFSVSPKKQVYYCFGCQAQGDSITLVAKMDGISVKEAMDKLTPEHLRDTPTNRRSIPQVTPQVTPPVQAAPVQPEGKIVKVYPYTDELGTLLYEVCRIEPGANGKKKDFRARYRDGSGRLIWNINGIRRVLYNLPNVLRAPMLIKVAGEKDADTVNALGLTGMAATTNVFGEQHWLPAYADTFSGKDVVIFGDNDATGRDHVKQVLESLAGKVKTARVIFPSCGKDITDYCDNLRQSGKNDLDISLAVEKLINAAVPLTKGIDLPIYSMRQKEVMYRNSVTNEESLCFDFGKILPTLGRVVRPARRGELITIIAPTSVGKTELAQIIAIAAAPLPTLFFELELSPELMFEREVGMVADIPGDEVERIYKAGNSVPWKDAEMGHIYTCPLSRISPDKIEFYINQAELVIGERPVIVVVDYAQLVGGVGDRRERVATTAEQMRIIARSTKTIMFLTSQVGRKEGAQFAETNLQSGKEAGEIENSSRLLLGMYMDKEIPNRLYIKVEKDTKGRNNSGYKVSCVRTHSMRLHEVVETDIEPTPFKKPAPPPQTPTEQQPDLQEGVGNKPVDYHEKIP